MTLLEEFDAWVAEEGITLVGGQRRAAGAILESLAWSGLLGGRGSGKTFLLEVLDRFLADRLP